MADGAGTSARPSGRIKPSDADQVVIAAMIHIASSVFDDSEREVALILIGRALPMVTSSSRMQVLAPVARQLIEAAPQRNKRGDGSVAWCRATIDLRRVVARDALNQAMARVEA